MAVTLENMWEYEPCTNNAVKLLTEMTGSPASRVRDTTYDARSNCAGTIG